MNTFESQPVDEISDVPRECVKFPPPEGENGRVYSVCCTDSECGWFGNLTTDYAVFDPSGSCPDCGNPLQVDFIRHSWGIGARGVGYHSTKFGQRVKKDRIARSEKLAKTQWETNQPLSVVNPEKVVNPTSGGVFDPNSRFNKHKDKNSKIIY